MRYGVDMTNEQIIWATSLWFFAIAILYKRITFSKIGECYGMWFTREYWTNYNIVEFTSWLAKAIIIIPGLIFGIQIWELYYLTAITSATLIWASNRKLLPTLVGFNTMWLWLSFMVLAQHLIG